MAQHTSNIFSIRLKMARKAKSLSQERLGILAGIDESSASARMNQYETGNYNAVFLFTYCFVIPLFILSNFLLILFLIDNFDTLLITGFPLPVSTFV